VLLKAIDGVDQMTQSGEVFSVEVHNKPRQMGKFRFVRFGGQGFGQSNFPFRDQDIGKMSPEFFRRLFSHRTQ